MRVVIFIWNLVVHADDTFRSDKTLTIFQIKKMFCISFYSILDFIVLNLCIYADSKALQTQAIIQI